MSPSLLGRAALKSILSLVSLSPWFGSSRRDLLFIGGERLRDRLRLPARKPSARFENMVFGKSSPILSSTAVSLCADRFSGPGIVQSKGCFGAEGRIGAIRRTRLDDATNEEC